MRRKVQGLVAILEIALARIRVEMENPGADLPRLRRVKENLTRTHRVCKQTLGKLEESLAEALEVCLQPRTEPMSCREYVELSSLEEYHRLRDLPPVRFEEIQEVNLDGLGERLTANE